jgi:hypothetical protein
LSELLVILSLAVAIGSAQMGMQNFLGLSSDINNGTGLAQIGSAMQNSIGLPDDINNDTPNGDYLGFSFPWYSSDVSFSSSGLSIASRFNSSHELSSAFSFFRGFYTNSGMPSVTGIISTPIKFDITHREPARIYFGSGHELQYTRYVSSLTSRNNELWIQGSSSGGIDWSQYVVCPSGAWLQLVAYSPGGGPAGFYEIVQNEAKTLDYTHINSTFATTPCASQLIRLVDTFCSLW